MKVEVENLSGHFKKLKIEVPVEKVSGHFTTYFRDVQKEVTLKGFRKGKAPLSLVREMYSDSAANKVLRKIVESHLGEALREHLFEPVNTPQIDVETLSETVPFKFTATFENTPPVELKDYTSLKKDSAELVVGAEEVAKTLDNIRSQMANFEPAEPGAILATGQFAQMDYAAKDTEGNPVPEASEQDSLLELGAGSLNPEFEQNVFGMKEGDSRTFSVSFPPPAEGEEGTPVSGKTLTFDVSLKGIRNKKLPEWNDELAQKVGPFASFEMLRSRVEADLKEHKKVQARRDLQEEVLKWIIEKNPVDCPESMLNAQMEQLAVDAGVQLSKMGLNEAAIEERLKGWTSDMTERATQQVKSSLVLSAIAAKEQIKVSDEDIRMEVVRMADQSKRKPQEVWEDLQKRGLIGGLMRQVKELKALDWVCNRVSS